MNLLRGIKKRGFTLIELLIVVAIIAILAAIAVPNFLEAQVRSKVSRAKADMRSLATALESYMVDERHYPPYIENSVMLMPVSYRLHRLTTPVAYITKVPKDSFQINDFSAVPPPNSSDKPEDFDTFDYVDAEADYKKYKPAGGRYATSGAVWRLSSPGPDKIQGYGWAYVGGVFYGDDYDPTNGTVSNGDIVRVGARSEFGTDEPNLDRIQKPPKYNVVP